MSDQQIKALHDINSSLTQLNILFKDFPSRVRREMNKLQQQTLDQVKSDISNADKLFPSGRLTTTILENLNEYLPELIDKYINDARIWFESDFPTNILNVLDEPILAIIQSHLDSLKKNMAIVRSKTMSLDSNLPNQYFVQTTRQNASTTYLN